MRKLMNRLNKKEGFTLAELLIVVAIIAVLVAVSIPIFTSRLEKARQSTDLANIRAAYAAGVAEYLGNEGSYASASDASFYYDTGAGSLVTAKVSGGVLKATQTVSPATTIGGYPYAGKVAGSNIKVTITSAGSVTIGVE